MLRPDTVIKLTVILCSRAVPQSCPEIAKVVGQAQQSGHGRMIFIGYRMLDKQRFAFHGSGRTLSNYLLSVLLAGQFPYSLSFLHPSPVTQIPNCRTSNPKRRVSQNHLSVSHLKSDREWLVRVAWSILTVCIPTWF